MKKPFSRSYSPPARRQRRRPDQRLDRHQPARRLRPHHIGDVPLLRSTAPAGDHRAAARRRAAAPIYLYVPPAHQQNWRRYCGHYHACSQPVYFVRDEWVRERYEHEHPGWTTATIAAGTSTTATVTITGRLTKPSVAAALPPHGLGVWAAEGKSLTAIE